MGRDKDSAAADDDAPRERAAMDERAYLVRGRVQGVGFRWWVRRVADELGLGGHVLNRLDGSVEVHAVGERNALDELGRTLATGPVTAHVTSVDQIEADQAMTPGVFRIELR